MGVVGNSNDELASYVLYTSKTPTVINVCLIYLHPQITCGRKTRFVKIYAIPITSEDSVNEWILVSAGCSRFKCSQNESFAYEMRFSYFTKSNSWNANLFEIESVLNKQRVSIKQHDSSQNLNWVSSFFEFSSYFWKKVHLLSKFLLEQRNWIEKAPCTNRIEETPLVSQKKLFLF